MSYYPTPGAPYVPQQPVNPYGGMGTVGLATPLPNTQMQQAQPQRPQPMNGQQPVQQSAQDGGWLLGRPVSSREEFLAIPSDLYGRPTYCPDLRSGVIYCKRLNPDTCESYVQEFYSPEAWRQMQAQQAQQTAAPTQQYGGRGICVCDDWLHSFENFYCWAMQSGYSESLTIDRINVNENYCPENCRWVTISEQSNNQRKTIKITILGKEQSLKQWTTYMGWNKRYGTFSNRHRKGKPPFNEDELTQIEQKLRKEQDNVLQD